MVFIFSIINPLGFSFLFFSVSVLRLGVENTLIIGEIEKYKNFEAFSRQFLVLVVLVREEEEEERKKKKKKKKTTTTKSKQRRVTKESNALEH